MRQRERQTDIERGREAERHRERQRDRETERQRERETRLQFRRIRKEENSSNLPKNLKHERNSRFSEGQNSAKYCNL